MMSDFLPLGTVVLLKNGEHRLMIIGFGARLANEDNAQVYDYMGCLYPEGVFSTESSLVFNHSDIDKVYSVGYKDKETDEFMTKLNIYMNKH